MNFIKRVFGIIDRQYYIKNFTLGVVIVIISIYFLPGGRKISIVSSMMLNLFLFPYSKYIIESIKSFLFGGTGISIELPVLLFLFFKLISIIISFGLAFIIAPIGILYCVLFLNQKIQ